MKRSIRVAVGVLLSNACVASTPAGAVTINKILATVDGEPVTTYEVQQFTKENMRGRQLDPADKANLLEAVITEKMLAKEVSDKGVIVKDEEVNHFIDGIRERNHLSEEQLVQALKQQGMTLDAYRKQIREDIQRQQLVSREIRGKVSVTPEEVQRYYEAHKEEFSTPEGLKVAHIFLRLPPAATSDQVAATTAKAESIRDQLERGADFAALAKQYCEDGSGEHGGDLGWFKKGQLLEPLERAVQGLKVGDVSKPVRTPVGIHLVKLEAREGDEGENLAQVQEQIKQQLYSAAVEDRFQKWISEELRKRHHVEMLD